VNVPVLGIIENMSYYVCSHCGHRENIFDTGGGRKAAEELGAPFLGEIPLYTGIRVAGDTGRPVVAVGDGEQEGGDGSLLIKSIARNLAAQVSIRNARQDSGPVVDLNLG
jgi:ATP-binding protein involved in chromosome partitioning